MRAITLVLVAFVAVGAFGKTLDRTRSPYIQIWNAWKLKFNKEYESITEEVHRLRIFEDNAIKVMRHNLEHSLGLHTYTTGLNHLADLTNEEYKATYLTPLTRTTERLNMKVENVESVPSSIDWRDYGVVTGVKDQGQCGSCWSFAGTGSLEGQYALKYNNLLSFSEQQQVDCNQYCYGCDGGWAEYAFYYWMYNYGANLESDYPYKAVQGKCKTSSKKQYVNVDTYYTTKSKSESSLKQAVGSVGPVAIAIDASKWSFQLYSGGVYSDPQCSSTSLDHAVLAVGYGTDGGQAYWLVKNSWGSSWGLSGYIEMARNDNNMCGVATDGSYPQL